jgi:hypothetical protein
MNLEQKDIVVNDINFSSYGKDEDQQQDAKTAEGDSEQTEYKTVPSSITHKFKPKKRRMGNLILKSNCLVTDENQDGNARGSDAEYEYTNRTIGKTVSGILSKFFHSRRPDSFGETSEEPGNPEYPNLRLHDDLGESKTTRNKLSRVFETYRKRNGLQGQPKDEGYYKSNSEGEKSFNRFLKLEQALDAKRDEKNLRSMNDETERVSYTSKDLSLGSTVLNNSQEIYTENGSFVHPGSKGKIDTKFIINDSPKTESAALENTVFSPNSHRPSLRDIPGIENIEVSTSDQNTWKQSYSTFRMAFKIKPVKNILNDKSLKPQNSQFKSLDDEIDSHLYYQSRTNLLSKCFPNKNHINQNSKRESQNENIDFAPEMEEPDKLIPSIPTSPNSLSDNFTAIKGILQQKYKSSFSRDKSKRQNLSVKFVSPTLSPIEMTNNEMNDNGHNNTEIISQTTS